MGLQELKQWGERVFLGLHRLEKLPMAALRNPIAEAVARYGPAVETKPSEEFPAATEHSFEASIYHGVVVYEWNGLIHSVAYWSAYGDPNRDLACMFDRYGEAKKWDALTAGYLYYRADREVMLWCSAIPAIGIGTIEYQEAKTEFKKRLDPTEID